MEEHVNPNNHLVFKIMDNIKSKFVNKAEETFF